jgi:hypothetical protein
MAILRSKPQTSGPRQLTGQPSWQRRQPSLSLARSSKCNQRTDSSSMNSNLNQRRSLRRTRCATSTTKKSNVIKSNKLAFLTSLVSQQLPGKTANFSKFSSVSTSRASSTNWCLHGHQTWVCSHKSCVCSTDRSGRSTSTSTLPITPVKTASAAHTRSRSAGVFGTKCKRRAVSLLPLRNKKDFRKSRKKWWK